MRILIWQVRLFLLLGTAYFPAALSSPPDYLYTNPIQVGASMGIIQDEKLIELGDRRVPYSHCSQYEHCIVSHFLKFATESSCKEGDTWALGEVTFRVISVGDVNLSKVSHENYCVIESRSAENPRFDAIFGFSPNYGLIAIGIQDGGMILVDRLPAFWTKQ